MAKADDKDQVQDAEAVFTPDPKMVEQLNAPEPGKAETTGETFDPNQTMYPPTKRGAKVPQDPQDDMKALRLLVELLAEMHPGLAEEYPKYGEAKKLLGMAD